MLWESIFVNAVSAHLPRRVAVDSVAENPGLAVGSAPGAIESITHADKPAYVMAGLAAEQAVARSDHRNEKISPIVYTEISLPIEHLTPVCYIQRVLDQPDSLAFGLEAASDGGPTGIEAVARILSGSPDLTAGLVCAASRIRDGVDRWVGGQLVGDGAVAAVISKKGGFARLVASQRTSLPDLEILQRNPGGPSDIDRAAMPVGGLGPYISTIARYVSTIVSAILTEARLSIDDISYFLPPTLMSVSVEEMYLRRSGIPFEKTCWPELQKNGHVGPCDQLLGIEHLMDTDQLKEGQFVMLLGGGYGWRLTCMLLQALEPATRATP